MDDARCLGYRGRHSNIGFLRVESLDNLAVNAQSREQQLEDQKIAAADAIEAQRELSVGSRQRTLLGDYHVALMGMAEAAAEIDSDIEKYVTRATTAWTTWSMEMHVIDPKFRQLTGLCHFNLRMRAAAIRIEAEQPNDHGLLESMFKHQDRDELQAKISDYVSRLFVWQADPSRWEEIHSYLMEDNEGHEA